MRRDESHLLVLTTVLSAPLSSHVSATCMTGANASRETPHATLRLACFTVQLSDQALSTRGSCRQNSSQVSLHRCLMKLTKQHKTCRHHRRSLQESSVRQKPDYPQAGAKVARPKSVLSPEHCTRRVQEL